MQLKPFWWNVIVINAVFLLGALAGFVTRDSLFLTKARQELRSELKKLDRLKEENRIIQEELWKRTAPAAGYQPHCSVPGPNPKAKPEA